MCCCDWTQDYSTEWWTQLFSCSGISCINQSFSIKVQWSLKKDIEKAAFGRRCVMARPSYASSGSYGQAASLWSASHPSLQNKRLGLDTRLLWHFYAVAKVFCMFLLCCYTAVLFISRLRPEPVSSKPRRITATISTTLLQNTHKFPTPNEALRQK